MLVTRYLTEGLTPIEAAAEGAAAASRARSPW